MEPCSHLCSLALAPLLFIGLHCDLADGQGDFAREALPTRFKPERILSQLTGLLQHFCRTPALIDLRVANLRCYAVWDTHDLK